MTTEVGTKPRATPDDRAVAMKAILESLKGGGSSASVLKTILASANLSPDQEVLVDALIEMDADEDVEPAEIVSDEMDERIAPGRFRRDLTPKSSMFRLRREIADLREANDTLASALGACPVCWGGDSDCEICDGRGSAGYAAPNPELFREFVLPAVRRVRDMGQAPARTRRG